MQDEKQKIMSKAETEITNAEIYIGFYKHLAEIEKDEQKAAGFQLKADQLKGLIDFNNLLLTYLKTQ